MNVEPHLDVLGAAPPALQKPLAAHRFLVLRQHLEAHRLPAAQPARHAHEGTGLIPSPGQPSPVQPGVTKKSISCGGDSASEE